MKMLLRLLLVICAFAVVEPALAGQQKPLVIKNGQLQQIQPGDVLDASQAVNVPLATGVTGTLPVGSGGTGTASGAANLVFGTPDGSAGAPGFRSLALHDLPYFANPSAGPISRPINDKLADIINVKDFGAVCDGVTDDAAKINAALSYAGSLSSAIVQLPSTACKVSSTLIVPQNVAIRGKPGKLGGLAAGVPNLNPMIYLSDEYASVEDVFINMSAAGANTSGYAISTATKTGDVIRNVRMEGPCGAIDINGNGHEVSHIYINNASGTACSIITVGRNTTLSGSNDIKFDQVTVTSVTTANRSAYCWDIRDAGGLFITHSDAIYCNVGTVIRPGANQEVDWATFHDTYMADTNASNGIVISPTAASGVVKGLNCSNCWSGTSGAAGLLIQNPSSGTITTLNFVGLRVFGSSGNAVSLLASDKFRFDASMLCGYGSAGIYAGSGVSNFSVTNSTIRPDCASLSSAGLYGVLLTGSNASVTLANLDVQANATANVAGVPTGNSFVSNIVNQGNVFGTKASAATIALDQIISNWTITGTTGISTINGFWAGRQAMLVTTGGAVAFSTGGNICNALTSTQNVPILATYSFNSSCWYLK